MEDQNSDTAAGWPFNTQDKVRRMLRAMPPHTPPKDGTWTVTAPDGSMYFHGNPMVASALGLSHSPPQQFGDAITAMAVYVQQMKQSLKEDQRTAEILRKITGE